jgi:hypothetical protein
MEEQALRTCCDLGGRRDVECGVRIDRDVSNVASAHRRKKVEQVLREEGCSQVGQREAGYGCERELHVAVDQDEPAIAIVVSAEAADEHGCGERGCLRGGGKRPPDLREVAAVVTTGSIGSHDKERRAGVREGALDKPCISQIADAGRGSQGDERSNAFGAATDDPNGMAVREQATRDAITDAAGGRRDDVGLHISTTFQASKTVRSIAMPLSTCRPAD